MSLKLVLAATFHQISDVLKQIDQSNYQKPLDIFSQSSIGQHTRHTLEFMQCLLTQCPSGSINYDKRIRNHAIETDPIEAIKSIEWILTHLADLQDTQALLLESNYSYGNKDEWVHTTTTTVERELVYNIEHAIHHMAIMKIGIKEVAPEIVLPEGFGVAPSTIRHRRLEEIKN